MPVRPITLEDLKIGDCIKIAEIPKQLMKYR